MAGACYFIHSIIWSLPTVDIRLITHKTHLIFRPRRRVMSCFNDFNVSLVFYHWHNCTIDKVTLYWTLQPENPLEITTYSICHEIWRRHGWALYCYGIIISSPKKMTYLHISHYVIMSAMASQITSLTIVYSSVYWGADQRKHQSPASLAFVRGIHRWPVNSPHKGQVTRKLFPFQWWRHHVPQGTKL